MQRPSAETAKGEVTVEELNKLQQTVARRMAESKATAPHFYSTAEIDMSAAVEARSAAQSDGRRGRVVPSFNDMVVKACAIALREYPQANGAYRDGSSSSTRGSTSGSRWPPGTRSSCPTVFDADRKGLRQIATDTRAAGGEGARRLDHPARALGRRPSPSPTSGCTGSTHFSAVINTPQAAILAVGAIKERPACATARSSPPT